MRLREVFRFELAVTLRNASTWVYAVLLFLFAGWILLGSWDEGEILFNAPIRLAFGGAGAGIFGVLVTAGLCSSMAVRDVEAEMDSLLFTSGLSRTEYLGGRYLAALAVNALLLLAIPLGQLAATLLVYNLGPDSLGPFRIGAYLQAFPLVLIPGLLGTSAVLFTIAMFARQVIPVYLGAILFFISAIVAGNYSGRIGNPLLSALADPFGLATLEGLSRQWTQAEQDTRMVGFPTALVWSRLGWIALAAAALAILHRWFRFGHDDGGGRRRKGRKTIADPGSGRTVSVAIPRINGAFDRFTWVRQTLAVARRCFAEVAANRAFLVTLLLAFGLTLLWGWNVGSTVFDSPVWPVTHLVASVALSQRNAPIIYLLIALWAGEMVWKDRNVGMAEIGDAAPVSEGVALLGRFLAVVAALVVLQAVVMAAGVTLQALQGYYRFEAGLYLKIVFGISLANYVLLAALAMTIHVVVNNKYVGHMLMILALVLTQASRAFGIHNNLLIYGKDPGWRYSDMNGFGPFIGPFIWFKLYWAAWALLLLVVSSVLWVRGREPGFRPRLRVARARLVGPTARAAGVAIALILVLGGFIFYNTSVLNACCTPDERNAPQAEYEKRYKRFENAPQPTIVAAEQRIEIYPEKRVVDLSGTYHLINRSGAAIDSVHVMTVPEIEARSFSFDRAARPVLVDEEVGYRIYALDRALEQRDSLRLAFDVSRRPRGFPNRGIPTDVVENGSYFDRRWLPFVGYQPALELTDPRPRERLGLAPRRYLPSATDSAARQSRQLVRNEDRVRAETIIGTAGDQIALTSGVLRRSWTEAGRRYFHYDTDGPESSGIGVFSARYAVREDRWTPDTRADSVSTREPAPQGRRDATRVSGGHAVALRIFHHPRHTGSLGRMVHGMNASLDYFTEQFGPYPYRDLRIAEVPPYGGYGRALPNIISFTEDIFLFRIGENDVDEPFYGTAHEVAHTWWGGMVRGAFVAGHNFLSESLANYSAMILMEKTFGPDVARRVYDVQMGRYFTGRARIGREVPVLHVEDQPYISYRRGALALYTLREHIGLERVNSAIRRYADKFRDSGPPFPTSYDLYAELRAVTPDSLHTLLADLLERITLWDVRASRATVERIPTGEYEVTLDVVAKKMRADSTGKETEVPMDDLVEIGVFGRGDDARSEPLYLKRHRIRSGKQTIRITVPREPARAGIDPYRKLFDRQRDDNVVSVGGPVPGGGNG
jgi:ABC-2 type transport system permease protein